MAFALRDIVQQGRDETPTRLDELETRMALYRHLAARFHCTPDELAARREAIEAKLSELDESDADLLAIDEPLATAWKLLKQAAVELTIARCKLAGDFARVMQRRLKPLGLAGSRVTVEIETPELGDDPSVFTPARVGSRPAGDSFLGKPRRAAPPLAQDCLGWRIVTAHARRQGRPRGR